MAKKPIEFKITVPIGPGQNIEEDYRVIFEPDDPITKCTIKAQYHPIADMESVWRFRFMGIGVRKGNDTYNLETGCRMALKSALKYIKNEDVRRLIWQKYLEVFPPTPPADEKPKAETFEEVFTRALAASLEKRLKLAFVGTMPIGTQIRIPKGEKKNGVPAL